MTLSVRPTRFRFGAASGLATLPVYHADEAARPADPPAAASCFYQFVSHDSGAHWSQQSFPWRLQLLPTSAGGTSGFPGQVQGTTLFAAVTGNLNGEAL